MKTEYDTADTGNVSVNNEVIKNIALKAATEIGGIHEMRRGYLKKIWSAITKKNTSQGVKLDFADESEVTITLKLNIEYGANISEAAGAAQDHVKKAVEHMTGLTVTEVVVKISGMHDKKEIPTIKNLE